ncbi:MAG: hypothetical protein J0M11_12790 [Anaerolineae bacterium]|nr:hypothetical protein [Anaerolineae bacterium]
MSNQNWILIIGVILLVPLWRVVICLSATLHMVIFARLANLEFDVKKFFIKCFTHSFPSIGVALVVDDRVQSVKSYVTLGYRMSMEHRLAISVKSRAKPGSRLKVTPNTSWFRKQKTYFGDSWDSNLIVQSTPRDFGRNLLMVEELRERLYNALRGDGFIPEYQSSLIISRTGTVTLNVKGMFWNPWRTKSLLELVDSIAKNAG